MLSKSDSKFIKSLQLKKYRKASGLFVTEGQKNLSELLQSPYQIEKLFVTDRYYQLERDNLERWYDITEIVQESELVKSGTFKSNNAGLALVKIPQDQGQPNQSALSLALDDIRDPGNLGTIIRIADWYGIGHIACSESCADCYNPKVINSSMGSFFRVRCNYVNLQDHLSKQTAPVLGASMEGESVHSFNFDVPAILVIGSESHGINPDIRALLTKTISIPSYGKAESLNAAMATAILCDNYFRQAK